MMHTYIDLLVDQKKKKMKGYTMNMFTEAHLISDFTSTPLIIFKRSPRTEPLIWLDGVQDI